jgi:ribonuclease BN (tRNA processing enzyme)
MQIHRNIRKQVWIKFHYEKVLLSHLHKDHVSGAGGKRCRWKPNCILPQAIYYVQQRELEYALKRLSSYEPEQFAFLENISNLVKLEGSGLIDGYISYELTGAIAPFTRHFILKRTLNTHFSALTAPQKQQMVNRFGKI